MKYIKAWFLLWDIQVILDRMVTYDQCLAAVSKAPYKVMIRYISAPELMRLPDNTFTEGLVALANRNA